jgi:mannose-6-phosphate isomerase
MNAAQVLKEAVRLEPRFRDYVWGGDRLRPGISPTAEAWVIYEGDTIAGGPFAGKTLGEAAAELGESLLGPRVIAHSGPRFPLLVKLLDCAAWLSLQVHPNDEQARRLEGPDQFGKTEAWFFIEAAANAEILCGLRAGSTPGEMETAVRGGKLLDLMTRHAVHPGDSIFIRPGMIHALGPGMLVYEVQQTSDITYRVWDWDRPATAGRALHIEKTLAVADPYAASALIPAETSAAGVRRLITCDYFALEQLTLGAQPLHLDTEGQTFHALTCIFGEARLEGQGWQTTLRRFESTVIPAACGTYQITGAGQVIKTGLD